MVKLHFLLNHWSDVNHIWQLWSSDDCLPSLYVWWPVAILFSFHGNIQFWKRTFSNDNFKTTEALWLLFGIKVAWVRAIQNRYNYGGLPLGYVAMATESSHWLIMGKWLNCIFMPCHKKWQVYYVILSEILSVCPGKHPRFRGYFGHNYEVFWGLFHLKCIS